MFPDWFLIFLVKKARDQLLGKRYRWDFKVTGDKERFKEGSFLHTLE